MEIHGVHRNHKHRKPGGLEGHRFSVHAAVQDLGVFAAVVEVDHVNAVIAAQIVVQQFDPDLHVPAGLEGLAGLRVRQRDVEGSGHEKVLGGLAKGRGGVRHIRLIGRIRRVNLRHRQLRIAWDA